MKYHLIALLLATPSLLHAASTQVYIGTQPGHTLKDFNGAGLSAGTPSNGDGTILQLGYYTASTQSNPFAGDWVPMTGPGTPYPTTTGDSENWGSGEFKIVIVFTQGSYSFPESGVGTPLALRFYDSTSIASSTYFNAVSDTTGDFNWVAPSNSDSSARLSFLSVGIVWQDGPSSAGRTTIIPEPSSAILLGMIGLGALTLRRRPN